MLANGGWDLIQRLKGLMYNMPLQIICGRDCVVIVAEELRLIVMPFEFSHCAWKR